MTAPVASMDHRPYGAERYGPDQTDRPKKLSCEGVTEKDLKTSANMDTKFQQVQKKWSGGSLKSPDLDLDLEQLYKREAQSGSSSVRSLSSRYHDPPLLFSRY